MAGFVVAGLLGCGVSGYGLISSIRSLNITDEKKKILSDSVVSLDTIIDPAYISKPSDSNGILSFYLPTVECGFLEIAEKTTEYTNTYISDKNTGILIAGRTRSTGWAPIGKFPYGATMGLPSFVPPIDLKMFLHDGKYVETSSGSKSWLQNYLPRFGFSNVLLSNGDKFSLTNKPYNNGYVFIYGIRLPSGTFSAQIMGNNKSLVINKAFEQEDATNGLSIIASSGLLVLSLFAIVVGSSK